MQMQKNQIKLANKSKQVKTCNQPSQVLGLTSHEQETYLLLGSNSAVLSNIKPRGTNEEIWEFYQSNRYTNIELTPRKKAM